MLGSFVVAHDDEDDDVDDDDDVFSHPNLSCWPLAPPQVLSEG
jgi:hypothetical protein